jgi:hypothetical protein
MMPSLVTVILSTLLVLVKPANSSVRQLQGGLGLALIRSTTLQTYLPLCLLSRSVRIGIWRAALVQRIDQLTGFTFLRIAFSSDL